MAGTLAPHEVRTLAHERRAARLARDWATADRLKAAIESAGWRVVDRGPDFALEPAYPPDREVDGQVRYGAPERVPSLLQDDPLPGATVVVLGPGGVVGGAGPRVRVVGGEDASMTAAGTAGDELVPLHDDASIGALAEAGLRRVATDWVVLLPADATATPTAGAGLLAAIAAGVPDDVAALGRVGARTADLHAFEPVADGDADVLLAGPIAARRADLAALLPFDRRIVSADRFAQWLTLALRRDAAGVEANEAETAPRRAVVVPGADPAERDRRAAEASADQRSKRDFYRLLDRFGLDPSLLSVGR